MHSEKMCKYSVKVKAYIVGSEQTVSVDIMLYHLTCARASSARDASSCL
jgi:hypothetical protein